MSMRLHKKSIYLMMVAATMLVSIALFIFIYPQETLGPQTETGARTLLEEERVGESPEAARSSEPATEAPGEAESGANEWPDPRASEEQLSTQRRAHTPEELSRYIDRMGRSFSNAQTHLSKADVPALLTMLGDPVHSQKWWDIETLLGYLIEEEESVNALIAFIQRGEDWESLPHPRPRRAMLAKVDAISKLGYIGGDAATDALRALLTEEGANRFLSEWIDDEIGGRDVSRTLIRGKAAFGLVFTQEATNILLVDAFYQSVFPQVRLIHQRPNTGSYYAKYETKKERYQFKLYHQAVSALATRDYIESAGLEEYMSLVYLSERDDAISPFLGRYRKALEE